MKIEAKIYRARIEKGAWGPRLGGVIIWSVMPHGHSDASLPNMKKSGLRRNVTNTKKVEKASGALTARKSLLHQGEIGEKVWLGLFVDVMFWIFQRRSNAPVPGSLNGQVYRFQSRIDPTKHLDLAIAEADLLPREFQWITLAERMMLLLVKAATMSYGVDDYSIKLKGNIVAHVSLGAVSSSGPEEGDGEGETLDS